MQVAGSNAGNDWDENENNATPVQVRGESGLIESSAAMQVIMNSHSEAPNVIGNYDEFGEIEGENERSA